MNHSTFNCRMAIAVANIDIPIPLCNIICLWFLTNGKLECDALRWSVVLNTRALEKLIPLKKGETLLSCVQKQ